LFGHVAARCGGDVAYGCDLGDIGHGKTMLFHYQQRPVSSFPSMHLKTKWLHS